jgi:quinol monooxygenase YgiN
VEEIRGARRPEGTVADVEITVVAGVFQARSEHASDLAAILARYVVLTRAEAGCRNVDLVASASQAGRFLVVEKWDDAAAQRAHLDGETMVTMATDASAVLASPPDLDLYEVVSAHDLL